MSSLQRDYIRIHNLSTPVVQHVREGKYLLRNKDTFEFPISLFKIKWNSDHVHPGTYKITRSIPLHNAFNKSVNLYNETVLVEELSYRDYESFFYKYFVQNPGHELIHGKENIILSAWEMFCYCFDAIFAQMNDSVIEMLVDSLDKTLPGKQRKDSISYVRDNLDSHQKDIIDKHFFSIHSKNYANWLIDIYNFCHEKVKA